MVQIFSALIAILATSTALALPTLEERTVSPPKGLAIEGIVYGGTGCPQGSADVYLSPDGTAFSVALSKDMSAKLGTGVYADTRKFCQFNFDLRAPAGFQYAVVTANYSGFANLGAGTKAKHATTFYWSGETQLSTLSIPLLGPAKYIYNIQAAAVVGDELWSPCGCDAALNIKSEIQVSGTGWGEITEFRAAGKISTLYGLIWRKC